MVVRIKKEFRGKDGGKHPHVKNVQDFPHNPATPRQMLLMHTKQYLGYLDWFAAPGGIAEALPVVTVRAALRLLIEFLERNK